MVWSYSIQHAVLWSGPVPEDPLHSKLVHEGPVQAQLGDEGSHSYTESKLLLYCSCQTEVDIVLSFSSESIYSKYMGNKFVPCLTAWVLKTEFRTGNIDDDKQYTLISWSTGPLEQIPNSKSSCDI